MVLKTRVWYYRGQLKSSLNMPFVWWHLVKLLWRTNLYIWKHHKTRVTFRLLMFYKRQWKLHIIWVTKRNLFSMWIGGRSQRPRLRNTKVVKWKPTSCANFNEILCQYFLAVWGKCCQQLVVWICINTFCSLSTDPIK